ncbi:unnamed protein product, partial [Discosporangium mesarthrocarpum]
KVNGILHKVQQAVMQFEATLRQFIIDDKGTIAIVVFGLPPIFHEDNAARGVSLGFKLLQQGVKVKIGVTTGTAFAGVIGNASRSEYAAVGDVVNMSARLMGKATPNTMLCDAQTRKEAGDQFNFKESMRIKVKGKEHLITVYEPLSSEGLRRNNTERSKFVDRGLDTTGLQDLIDGARKPAGNKTVLIEGERGSGKSVLLSQAGPHSSVVVDMMDRVNLHTFCSAGDMHERQTSLYPFRQILCQLLGNNVETLMNTHHHPVSHWGPRGGFTGGGGGGGVGGAEGTVGGGVAEEVHLRKIGVRRRSSEHVSFICVFVYARGRGKASESNNRYNHAGSTPTRLHSPRLYCPPAWKLLLLPFRLSSLSCNVIPTTKRIHTHHFCLRQVMSHNDPKGDRARLHRNPILVSLMQDLRLNKHLHLLNMIMPLYNDSSVGGTSGNIGILDHHEKLRHLGEILSALLVVHLQNGVAGSTGAQPSGTNGVPGPAIAERKRRGSIPKVNGSPITQLFNDTPEARGCQAAIVFDNAQWLDHNRW